MSFSFSVVAHLLRTEDNIIFFECEVLWTFQPMANDGL